MPNQLKRSLGQTGKMVEKSSQDYVADKLYINEGACVSICAKFMCDINNLHIPSEDDYVEAAQWVQSGPGWADRIRLMASASGLRQTADTSGSLQYDEIALSHFLDTVRTVPTFFIFGFLNNARTKGHALLFYRWAGEHWLLLDPNFGIAEWPTLSGLIVGLKRLLANGYLAFGPYQRFEVWKYER
ncbi:MAG TPA: hypothetical protein VN706_03030 [Gemmatimonadaceae bacterium]|nr:hypothetical protein [Gemmatimonadaceae bacterium]